LAYYVDSELITNTVKHARASAVRVLVTESREWLQLVVSDDGCGGADAAGGSGLTGLGDRDYQPQGGWDGCRSFTSGVVQNRLSALNERIG
jgi:glucose-6-phosphate-specific signal transduction histidine kinase